MIFQQLHLKPFEKAAENLFSWKHIYIILNSLEPYLKKDQIHLTEEELFQVLGKSSLHHCNLQGTFLRSFYISNLLSLKGKKKRKKESTSCLYLPAVFNFSVTSHQKKIKNKNK